MKTGYYWIAMNGKALIARWDGNVWTHEYGKSQWNECKVVVQGAFARARRFLGMAPRPIAFSCQPQCHCTQNPDGTWNINCS